ncbi:MAG TPA: DUF6049 family protein [Streptosporangiaceae bacterium]|nr:DUF6049 family protein [Streptosporangiaceae bacterium]
MRHTDASERGHARRLGRRAAAALLAAAVAAGPLALGALAEPALGASQQSPAAAEPSVFIESVSPQWARPNHTVTVTGVVRNGTAAPLDGLSIQLRSSASPLGNRDDLSLYAAGHLLEADAPEGPLVPLPGVIAPGQTVRWRATLDPATVGMTIFGVYPLAAQLLNNIDLAVATVHSFLPYWPGGTQAQLTQPLSIAWVWPILDQPYQAICRALLSDGLAASLAQGGRLNGLLAAGRSYPAADLTWAIDPAVAQTAQTMSHRYTVGAGPYCGGAKTMPADQTAATWLNTLISAVSGQQAFVTPYADVDVNALSHVGLDTDLKNAFAEGRSVGSQLLHLPASSGTIAWPTGGLADAGILNSLASNKISTVVLSSSVMPPSGAVPPSYTPSAQASAATGIGSSLDVLLADQTISELLASSSGPATNPGSVFTTEQGFLAQTAMIVAELPATARSVVVTPPRLWDPAPGLADGLLNETVTAPWLRPASLADLAATPHPTGQVARQAPPDHHVSKSELSRAYLRQVKTAGTAIRLEASIFSPADPGYLQTAIAALESANWPGRRGRAAAPRALLGNVLTYMRAESKKVSIIDSDQITLGGSSGRVPVSISNDLHTAVQVVLHASAAGDGRLSIGAFDGLVKIPAGKTTTIRLPVRAPTVGETDVTLILYSRNGSPLTSTRVNLTVHATRFGTLALVILCVALGVFVLTSSVRAIRRSRRDGSQPDNDHESSDAPGAASAPGSVGSGDDLANDDPPEDPDEYADARGRARR